MIKYYYRNVRGDRLTEIKQPEIPKNIKKGTWIHVEAPTSAEIETLSQRFNIERGLIEDALDEDEVPRLERETDQTFIYIRFAYKNQEGDMDTAPLLIMFDSQHVLTVSLLRLPAVDVLTNGRAAFATTQRSKLILLILARISDQYDLTIGQTSRKIKGIRTRLRNLGITNQDFIDFATIEDQLSEFLSSLQPTNAVLRRLLSGRQLPLFEEDHDIVEDLLLSNEQSIETIRSNLRSIANIREAYSAISANNLNRILTVLTIVTIVMSVPGLAMGLYGLNIPLPFQHTQWIFYAIVGINLAIMSSVLYVVRRKRII